MLLSQGATKEVLTNEGERPQDLIDQSDLKTIGAMLESEKCRMEHLNGPQMCSESESSQSVTANSSTHLKKPNS